MSRRQLYHLWDWISRIVGAIPPIAVALHYYPIWIKSGSSPTVSGTLIIVALIAAIPFFRKFKSAMNFIMNASMPVLWTLGAVVSYFLMHVSDQLFAICIGGLVGSVLSALICIIRNKYAEQKE